MLTSNTNPEHNPEPSPILLDRTRKLFLTTYPSTLKIESPLLQPEIESPFSSDPISPISRLRTPPRLSSLVGHLREYSQHNQGIDWTKTEPSSPIDLRFIDIQNDIRLYTPWDYLERFGELPQDCGSGSRQSLFVDSLIFCINHLTSAELASVSTAQLFCLIDLKRSLYAHGQSLVTAPIWDQIIDDSLLLTTNALRECLAQGRPFSDQSIGNVEDILLNVAKEKIDYREAIGSYLSLVKKPGIFEALQERIDSLNVRYLEASESSMPSFTLSNSLERFRLERIFVDGLEGLTQHTGWQHPFSKLREYPQLNGPTTICLSLDAQMADTGLREILTALRESGHPLLIVTDRYIPSAVVEELFKSNRIITHEQSLRSLNDFLINKLSSRSLNALLGIPPTELISDELNELFQSLIEYREFGSENNLKIVLTSGTQVLSKIEGIHANPHPEPLKKLLFLSFSCIDFAELTYQTTPAAQEIIETFPIAFNRLGEQPHISFENPDSWLKIEYLFEHALCTHAKISGWGDKDCILLENLEVRKSLSELIPTITEIDTELGDTLKRFIDCARFNSGVTVLQKMPPDQDSAEADVPRPSALAMP